MTKVKGVNPKKDPLLRDILLHPLRSRVKVTRINDAVIAQQALELKAPVLTNDVNDFRKVHELKVVALDWRVADSTF